MAALRTLVLPYGATAGTRIILDGVAGEILLYDAAGTLVGSIIADITDDYGGFAARAADGTYAILSAQDPPTLRLGPADVAGHAWDPAEVGAEDVSAGAVHWGRLYLTSPEIDGRDHAALSLDGERTDGTGPRVRVGAGTLLEMLDGNALIYRAGAGSDALNVRVTGDTTSRLFIRADGLIGWGPGGAGAVDTTLYRAAADTLATDDELDLENGLAAISGDRAGETQAMKFGTSVVMTDAGGNWSINTGFTTLRGFCSWNGDCTARPNMVLGNTRTGFPAAAGGTVTGRAYVGNTGGVYGSQNVRIDWIAFGV
jgi:hypothetical protein